MKCPQCSAEVQGGSTFCPACGARLDEAAGAPPNETAEKMQRLATGKGEQPEEELWSGGYSPKAMIGAWIGAALATVAAVAALLVLGIADPNIWYVAIGVLAALWVVLLIRLAYKRLSINYRLTNHRFFHEEGILSRVNDRIEVIDMDDITFKQGLIDRMVGVGSILISSSDKSTPEFWIYGIDNVQEVADMMDKARRSERRRRGMHIEAV